MLLSNAKERLAHLSRGYNGYRPREQQSQLCAEQSIKLHRPARPKLLGRDATKACSCQPRGLISLIDIIPEADEPEPVCHRAFSPSCTSAKCTLKVMMHQLEPRLHRRVSWSTIDALALWSGLSLIFSSCVAYFPASFRGLAATYLAREAHNGQGLVNARPL